jgi:phospholipase/lecithinase/hemolysin
MLGEIGGNDYNYVFLQTWPTSGQNGIHSMARMAESIKLATELVFEVAESIENAARELLDMGAVRMVIPGNFPIGCVPSYLAGLNKTTALLVYDLDGCLAVLNAFAELQNVRLREAVKGLRASYPAATIAYADYFGAYLRVLREARALGFDPAKTRTACCGAGAYNFDVGRMCGAPGASACSDPAAYVSWDGVHMTQHAYEAMTQLLYRGGLAEPAPIKWPVS